MEDPEIIYCEVIGPAKDAQPKPRQSQKNEDSILELVAANLVRPRRIPAPRTHTVFTSHCTKCDQNSSSKSQVAMRIAVVIILTIWSVAFTVLYFTTNVNIKPCVIEKKHKPFVANNSIVTNCSESKIIVICYLLRMTAYLSTTTINICTIFKHCTRFLSFTFLKF